MSERRQDNPREQMVSLTLSSRQKWENQVITSAIKQMTIAKLDELVKARFVEMFGDVKTNPNNWPVETIGTVLKSCESGWSGNGVQRKRQVGEIAVLKVSSVTKGYFVPEECKVLDNQAAMQAFSSFIDDQSLKQQQIAFVYRVINHIEQNGYMESIMELRKPPFDKSISFIKLFDTGRQEQLIKSINAIRDNAIYTVA